MTLSEHVKSLRKQENLTQQELADRAGVGIHFVRDLEQGKKTLQMDKVNVGLHAGFYFYSKIKVPRENENGGKNGNRIENLMYTKVVTRYYITPKFFVVMDLKTHLLHVECFQAGFGWAMPEFGTRLKNPFERISFKKEDKEELRID